MKTQNLKKEIIKIFKKYGLNNDHATISANALINALIRALAEIVAWSLFRPYFLKILIISFLRF